MKKIDLGTAITLLANIGVLFGVLLLVYELSQNTQQLRLQLQFDANQNIFDNNRDLLGPNPTPIYAKSITNPNELNFEEFLVASAVVFNWMNEWEERYLIYQAGLIDDQQWKRRVDEDIGLTLGNRFAQAMWQSSKQYYEPELVQYVDSRLSEISASGTVQWWVDTQEAMSDQIDLE